MVTYAGKLVLAPMVRAGELPTRLLALKHGADLVWSPEIVDKKLIQCQKETNTKLNTIDFVIPSSNDKKPSTVVFRTYPKLEKNKLIFQMGTSDPTLAVEAAKIVINEVDGIDINAGCPKHFSIHSGMGAALLKTPEKLCSILSELVEKVGKPYNKPISVKIRILEDEQSTIELVEKICQTGIANLTVHCRTTPMRNREAPIRDYLQTINKICKKNNVSLIMNGAISNRTHFENLRQELGFGNELGGMIAENAESNPSVFNETPLPWFLTCKEYLSIAEQFDNHVGNTKYMLTRIVPGKSKFFQLFTRCKTSKEINYVKEQIDDKGELINDPTDYLEECRKEEKN
ncbi:hypothetical protein TBLA_0A06710 [Henningerozyma blattae CBS 6284]|uniref:tRNA-dihydrouridine synthase n=1 Tax=Henningerozyma blattae (strain ATCC 34711 / CBS 6284 / DSM 70876 / NBRC 10599 / NRRL Y-10934 / UCD 77-7) TaxID=1071380 RepID=I2GWG1_HENB6|nr:hypothetical protein TBLA_0A06710 [Tetrapisispora blattae CBS 6284]CCH58463.1 hypothetical protein TBLA_0A06710 [Tetrapisispora blattae CBS 6284]